MRRLTWGTLALMLRREALAIRAEFEDSMRDKGPYETRLWWERSAHPGEVTLLNNLADRLEGKR